MSDFDSYGRSVHSSDSESITIPITKSAMSARRYSSSFSSMSASYHALPQSPDVAQDINVPSAIEEAELVGEVAEDSLVDQLIPPDAPVDSRIRWIHFMLGSAVLLPWNGASRTSRELVVQA